MLSRQGFRRTANVEEEILDAVQLSPTTSTRRLARRFDVSSTSVWLTLRGQQLYPFCLSRRQDLLPQAQKFLPVVNSTMHRRS
ncbi:unnamed protein product [Nezara viridula]|uniref:Uncharacterized protein n=1 Tax=Nezara viridula TaxID=85310 RepID=A0A9P0MNQ0_NEZVI|nr:unnamed protein product [Nezara viridula]